MQPEQPNTPSTDIQTSDAVTDKPVSDEQREGSSPGWWQRLFNRGPAPEETRTESGEPGDTSGASQTLKLTEEELQRRVQSEADRREAKRIQEDKRAQRRKLRDEDPWAYVEEERKEEQAEEQTVGVQQFFGNIGTAHDRVSIDPVVEMLPLEERDRILKLEGAGTGLEGRKLVVKESLKALEKHWRAEGAKDAEGKLRRNTAFRKQVLAEFRGGMVEPELLPGSSGSAADATVSALLRDRYGLRT